ncbi:MAG: YHS domain-containing protein [Candidatus Omnitrophica bacterium]|nr:YHS domain-containing protein [Candidatus Omnitrophota bacterium]
MKGENQAGNKLCPISGEPVSGTSFVEYEGKRYGLCCPGCEGMFLKDPAKYIAQMEAKEKSLASTTAVTPDAAASHEMEMDMEQGDL